MTADPRPVQGFTLIELLIAICLGAMIVYVSIAGLRMASQTVSATNRLSLENGLIRAGYFEAQRQFDFWNNLDDPDALLAGVPQPLRMKSTTFTYDSASRVRGLPFTPMSTAFPPKSAIAAASSPYSGGIQPGPPVTTAAANAAREKDEFWDSAFAWSPHDPRTWYRGNLANKHQESFQINRKTGSKPATTVITNPVPPNSYPQSLFGRYALFSNVNPMPALSGYSINTDPNPDPLVKDASDTIVPLAYGGAPVVHLWYPRQVQGLFFALGYAGFCEYLPPNSIYAFYKNNGSDTSVDGLYLGTIDAGAVGISGMFFDVYNTSEGRCATAHGIYRATSTTSFGYFNPRSPTSTGSIPTAQDLVALHYDLYRTGRYASENYTGQNKTLLELLSRTGYLEKLMAAKPDIWPAISVSVGRLIKNGHHVALARITSASPLTSQRIELSWTGLGTTLRGARMQRKPNGGWAAWNNDGSANDPHLDSP